ncbi:hypothetical protein HU200_002602 [Digitaria exilis]|uniref:No apical meristem-associated C-terminal domain-containing protein n=1 Tax=Digitaria exilis TaxID=1010633 RepID=A0A835KVD7_9POAL|nr:hypothetical protein HU200_002602 [Digitaria exilis]
MNRSNSNKQQTKSSNRATGEPATVVPDGASSPCVVNMGGAHSSAAGGARSSAAGGAPRASGLPTPCAPGASGLSSPRAPPTSGFLAVGGHAAGQWWPSPSSSEWIYPQGGFMNILQSPRVPFVNYPNGSQMQENFHFVGGPMNYSSTPSPNGSPNAGVAQVTEAVDVEDDDTIQPANSNARSNASATSIDPTDARSDRRLNWSNEEDIRLVSAWLHNSIDPVDGNDKKSDQYWILRKERKWSAYVKKLSKEKNSTSADPAHVVNPEDAPKKRPIGRDKAKEERNGKRKGPEAIVAIGEKLDKFMEATTKAGKIAEVQQNLADKKLEVAKEQTKSKMLDLYRELLCAPTSELSEEAKAERSKALERMASVIFPKDN